MEANVNADGRSLFWDEKMVGINRTASVKDHYRQRSQNRMILLFAVFITTLHLFLYLLFTQILDFGPLPVQDVVRTSSAHSPVRVPLEAHIMSKCLDSKDCLEHLVVPAMEKVYDKVDFKLSYIGTLDSDGGVSCKHGPSECLGNILELCAADLYPDPKIHLGFTMCMTQDYQEIPSRDLVHDCALEHGIDFDKLNDCISEEGKGMDLLEASVKRSIDKDVKYSCTVRLNDKVRCIRDDGEWKDCEGGSSVQDLIKDVESLYNSSNENGS